jgi:Protein of unknown function (DUF4239)
MNSVSISAIVFACVFGAAMLGMYMSNVLPEHHLSDRSKDVIKLGMGLVATLSALVLSLLISSAKNSFDAQSTELTQSSAQIVMLDRILAHYGPETEKARDMLRTAVVNSLDRVWSKNRSTTRKLEPPSRGNEQLLDLIQGLAPKDDNQRALKSQALNIAFTVGETRWLQYAQLNNSVPAPILMVLVAWLATLFFSFGLFAPRNATVLASLLVAALSVSGAVFLMVELYSPYGGLIEVSSAPLRAALSQLGN